MIPSEGDKEFGGSVHNDRRRTQEEGEDTTGVSYRREGRNGRDETAETLLGGTVC